MTHFEFQKYRCHLPMNRSSTPLHVFLQISDDSCGLLPVAVAIDHHWQKKLIHPVGELTFSYEKREWLEEVNQSILNRSLNYKFTHRDFLSFFKIKQHFSLGVRACIDERWSQPLASMHTGEITIHPTKVHFIESCSLPWEGTWKILCTML